MNTIGPSLKLYSVDLVLGIINSSHIAEFAHVIEDTMDEIIIEILSGLLRIRGG